ncbi:IclR family transcriptional regulator [Actinomycetospora sp. NBRC 106378]|uniref:IclR family transcriptional regulator n=1 Tax=Actinomycetospora sp. NBRC 106378 TaxID=3032208 RepID=UPI0024A0D7C2|nr:IclR family transcriptional regulator [Actinomycetospora sp. NBRC 106378]GLZ54650.1 IclR family transcriptional regulator [Actinomycetospora sp. NBRC 106378]
MSASIDPAPAPGEKVGAVQSVDRAVAILEFVAEQGEAAITDIAAALDVHKSTASRLVAALQRRSLLEQHGDRGRYALSFGLIRLASATTARLDVSRLGQPVCQRLAESLGETVNIAVSDGEAGITVAQESGTASVISENWVGRRTPLHASSAGKVLLAWMDTTDRRRVLRRPLEQFTEETIVTPAALRIELARVFDEGYARSFEELEVGMHAVAVPVVSADGTVGSALSVTGPAYRLPRRRARAVVAELKEGAAEISAKLGHRPV